MTTKQQQALRKSWLVQRLTQPPRGQGILGDNPFSFGGGLRNGGLSPEAMNLIRPIFGFDYMGSAEFEFGAVPEALQRMAKADLHAFTVDLDLATVRRHWRTPKDAPALAGSVTVYVLAPKASASEVTARLKAWAAGEERLKKRTNFSAALAPVEDWDSETAGWLELDNGFMWFTDQKMWQQTCDLFGASTSAVAA